MLFNSFQFLLFFVIVTPLYYLTPFKWRWLLLLTASCYFYAALIPAYLLVLFSIILVDYVAGIYIEKNTGKKRKLFLLMSIIANLGVLCTFKYYDFFVANINQLLAELNVQTKPFPLWHVILPFGLSFHTFQAMSYTIEVYRGNQKAEKHLGIYALYVMFYPQLVAGPIERPQRLIHQFYEKHQPDYNKITDGLKTMLWGFFMKVVVADRLALYVDYVYNDVGVHSKLALLTSVFFYSIQVYCDFAGYSLIAVGAAKTLGFSLTVNFRQPYMASSIRKFWTKWHITLSNWFRDYVYIPMGGNRVPYGRFVFNILFVFFLSGLWHGANWTFIVFGLLNGVYVIAESLVNPRRKEAGPLSRIGGIFYTYILISFAMIFFRSPGIQDAFTVISRIFDPAVPWLLKGEFDERAILLYSLFGIACVMIADIKREFFNEKRIFFYHKNSVVRMAACFCLVIIILMIGVFDGSQFVYFQF